VRAQHEGDALGVDGLPVVPVIAEGEALL
jgi:hypothetical protein